MNDDFGTIGYVITAIFALSWAVTVAIYRIKDYDRIEVTRA